MEDMPRKQSTPQKSDQSKVAPKRTRRAASKRVSASASASASDRPRLLTAEEKRQLILAHAAQREPVDSVQRFSLWTGVLVCVLVIGIGWLYTMRQTIAGAIQAGGSGQQEEFSYNEIKVSLDQNVDQVIQEIDKFQDRELMELSRQSAIMRSATNATGSAGNASGSEEGAFGTRKDLFQPNNSEGTAKSNPEQFQLPPGISVDN